MYALFALGQAVWRGGLAECELGRLLLDHKADGVAVKRAEAHDRWPQRESNTGEPTEAGPQKRQGWIPSRPREFIAGI